LESFFTKNIYSNPLLKLESTAADFNRKDYTPHCAGAVGGKNTRIIKPENSGPTYSYLSYEDKFEIVLLAVADSKYKLIYGCCRLWKRM
jgi:hypothetical protein